MTHSVNAPSRSGEATRLQLITVAERLFAERGLEAVSLRTVGQEAGQRNNSVAQYHFGSRTGLVDAIVEARSEPIEARRAALRADLGERPPEVADLLDLFVRPLAESIGTRQRPTYYLRFLARVVEQDSGRTDELLSRRPAGVRFVQRELRRLLADAPASTFGRRLRWMAQISLRVLADHEREVAEGARGAAALEQVLADLLVTLEALLRAPHEEFR